VPSEFATAAWLRTWRKALAVEKPDLALVPARVFEYVAEDLERGWKGAKNGRTGSPRFDRFDPIAGGFAVDGSIVVSATHIRLPRIGEVRLMPNVRSGAKSGRLPAGDYSYVRVVREHGEWFASVVREVLEPVRVTNMTPTIGLDPGIRKLATLSDGTRFENPRSLEQVAVKAEKARLDIARKQRAADKKVGPRKKGERRIRSKRLTRARRKLGKQLKRAADIRKSAINHATSAIAALHAVVAVEDTQVLNMTRRRKGRGRAAKAALNRRILDAAPGMLLRILDQKLRDRCGGGVIRVHAAYTSQDCSRCGSRNDCGSNEIYTCAACGLVIDRDVNAANNILARARVVAAGWSSTEKSAWEQGKTLRVRKAGRKARATIREQRRKDAA
jgi:putative transposase